MWYTHHDSTVKQTLYLCDNHFCIFSFKAKLLISVLVRKDYCLWLVWSCITSGNFWLPENQTYEFGDFSHLAQIIIPLVVIISVAQICYMSVENSIHPIVLCIPPSLTCQSHPWWKHVNIPHIVILLTYSIILFLHTQNIYFEVVTTVNRPKQINV